MGGGRDGQNTYRRELLSLHYDDATMWISHESWQVSCGLVHCLPGGHSRRGLDHDNRLNSSPEL